MTKYTFVKWAAAAPAFAVALNLASPAVHGQQAPATAEGSTTPPAGTSKKEAEKPAPSTPEAARPRTQSPSPLVSRPGASAPVRVQTPPPRPATPASTPFGYVIGADDVLSIVYWRDKEMSTDVQVRPDGKISLSLLNDVDAAGLTPDQLRAKLVEASKEYFEDPNITVIVKTINSRKVFIMGQVAKQGPYPLTAPTNVVQLISLAGGLGEYADSENIRVLREENGKQVSYRVNFRDLRSGKNLTQNIDLKPGDTVLVP